MDLPWIARPVPPVTLISPPNDAWRRDRLTGPAVAGLTPAADLAIGPFERSTLIASQVPERCVVVRETACWVHLGVGSASPLHVAYPSPVRNRFNGLVAHCVSYPSHATVRLGGVHVTTPVHTAADLARAIHPSDLRGADDPGREEASRREAVGALVALVRAGVRTDRIGEVLRLETGRANRRRALAVVDSLAYSLETDAEFEGTGAASGRTPVTR